MFERTVSMLRQMVAGHGRAGEQAQALPEERRVGVRYPSAVQTTLQPVNGAQPARLSACVRNISRGGANLLVSRALEPGDMVGVDLPSPDSQSTYTVLACVIHATPQSGGDWVVGCTFAQELSDAELRAFGGQRRKSPAPEDQRAWVRFPCRVKATCLLVGAAPEPPWPVEVLNISPSGIGLRVERRVETGALLSLDLHDVAGRVTTSILACVVHAAEPRDGCRVLGCNFIRELTDEELRALL
jgi:hypothetical protein